jgi:hypothetical protein
METASRINVRGTTPDRVTTAVRIVAGVLGLGYVLAGVVGVALGASEDGSDVFWWLLLLVGGGALVLAGAFALASRPVLSAVVTALGAVAGALALVWSIVAPLLAFVLVVLVVVRAARPGRS